MIALCLVFAFIDEIIATSLGFGFSTLFLPMATIFIDFKTALTLSAFTHIAATTTRTIIFGQHIDKKIFIYFGLPGIIATVAGALVIPHTSPQFLKFLLGCFILIYGIFALIKPTLSIPKTKLSEVLGGTISGFLAGIIGTGGAVRATLLSAFGLEKTAYVATAASLAFLVDVGRLPIYIANNFLEHSDYLYIPLFMLAAFLGTHVGKAVMQRIQVKQFKKLLLWALILTGIQFIVQNTQAL